jgi:hypothetical protein
VPVTARLSQKFYEKFGDDLTNELVDWFNKVDTTYRTELRELNELNFERFDAKLEQRLAQLDAKWAGRWTDLDAKIERRITDVKAALPPLESSLQACMAALEARLIKWMFLFWVGQAVTTVGLVFGVVRLTSR